MKIGFFTDRYFPLIDGVSVSIDIFARDLEKLGHEVFIFCPAPAKKIAHEPANIIRFRSVKSIFHPDHRDTMPWTPANARLIRSYDLDVIHVHTPTPIGFMGARIAIADNIPLITTYHTDIEQYAKIYKRLLGGFVVGTLVGPLILNAPVGLRERIASMRSSGSDVSWSSKLIRETLNAFHQNFDLVLAPSRKIERLLKKYHTPTKIAVLPTGIDLSETELKTNYDLRKEYGLPQDAPVLLYLGRIGQEKNLELLVRALPHVLHKQPMAKLVLAGPGKEETERLGEIAAGLKVSDSLIFTGGLNREQVVGAHRSSTMFVFPSITDTQGLVINEACAQSKPIVFVDDKISELTRNHHNGLHARNNPRDFAHKCLRLIEHPELREKFGAESKELAQNYSGENQALHLVELYNDVVEQYRSRL
jgi:glycosyltransferase involved in cell wall biosynthesis